MDHGRLGYLCGVLCGRGFVKHGRNNCVGIHTRNGQLAHHFAECIRLVRGFAPTIKEKNIDDKRYFIIDAYGKDLVKLLDGLGFFPSRKNWVPPRLANENAEFRLEFLAGFFDATSVVYFNREKFYVSGSGYRYLRATSVNPAGLAEIKKLLAVEGVESNLRTSKKGISCLTIRGDWRLKTFADRIKLRTDKGKIVENTLRPA